MAIPTKIFTLFVTAYVVFFALAKMLASTAIIKRTVITVDNPPELHLLAYSGWIFAKGISDGFE
jgi:hypothetical protein